MRESRREDRAGGEGQDAPIWATDASAPGEGTTEAPAPLATRRTLAARLALSTAGLLTAGALLAGTAITASGEELAALTATTTGTTATAPVDPTATPAEAEVPVPREAAAPDAAVPAGAPPLDPNGEVPGRNSDAVEAPEAPAAEPVAAPETPAAPVAGPVDAAPPAARPATPAPARRATRPKPRLTTKKAAQRRVRRAVTTSTRPRTRPAAPSRARRSVTGPALGVSAATLLQLQPGVALAPPPAPLPEIREIKPGVGRTLRSVGRRAGVAWPVLAAVARVESNLGLERGAFAGRRLGATGGPRHSLPVLAAWLKAHGASARVARPFESEDALRQYFGNAEQAERVAALAAYYYAVGTAGTEQGLAEAQRALEAAVLESEDVHTYAGGASDVELHRIDPRVLMVVRYLQASFGSVRVSSLITGHRVFSASGNVSAHVFGRAVDIAELGGVNIIDHQGPGSITERAVRLLLMLPKEVAPRQIISLIDLDGPTSNTGSFALADHWDHIHVGY